MKKRLGSVLLFAAMAASVLVACAKPGTGTESSTAAQSVAGESMAKEETSAADASGSYELALITDVGTIDDKSFNQGSWEGLEKYAKENNITYKYYKPSEKSDDAYMTSIDLAVKAGAKVIVTPGFLFNNPMYEAQDKYPDVKFVTIDAEPTNKDTYEVVIKDNVLSVFYAEEQAGYLAGYAAVKDGYRKLGFMGGLAVPAVVKFGYGFVHGADDAAKELGLVSGDVSIKYTYVGNFDASPENQTKAAAWYNEGVECIFACGGGVGNSVMKAAESAGTVVIGVDVDQSGESDTVITSAMKNLQGSVYNAIASYYDGTFEGGQRLVLDAKEGGIELPMATSKFKNFTKADYDKVYASLVDGSVKVQDDTVGASPTDVVVELVTVDLIQ